MGLTLHTMHYMCHWRIYRIQIPTQYTNRLKRMHWGAVTAKRIIFLHQDGSKRELLYFCDLPIIKIFRLSKWHFFIMFVNYWKLQLWNVPKTTYCYYLHYSSYNQSFPYQPCLYSFSLKDKKKKKLVTWKLESTKSSYPKSPLSEKWLSLTKHWYRRFLLLMLNKYFLTESLTISTIICLYLLNNYFFFNNLLILACEYVAH